jgi:hypothetical protein
MHPQIDLPEGGSKEALRACHAPEANLIGTQVINEPRTGNYILCIDAELIADDVSQLRIDAIRALDSPLSPVRLDHVRVQISDSHKFGCVRVGNLNIKLLLYPHNEFNGVEAHVSADSSIYSERG